MMGKRSPEQKEKPHLGDLVIATGNPAKFVRYERGLADHFDVNLTSLQEEGLEKVDEPFDTAEENARHKAINYFRQCGKPVLAIDEALYFDFLPADKQPGVYVRRFGGTEELSDADLLTRIQDLVKDVPDEKRTGYWRYAVCIAQGEDKVGEVIFDNHLRVASRASEKESPGYPLNKIIQNEGLERVNVECSDEDRRKADEVFMGKVIKAVRKAYGI
ncbi:non-canonical purine NTP pyrophosphatase [Patescibacteria group bacterium]